MGRRRLSVFLLLVFAASLVRAEVVTGVTFANNPGVMYVHLRESARALGVVVEWDDKQQCVLLDSQPYKESQFVTLFDGTKLIPVREFANLGATVEANEGKDQFVVRREVFELEVVEGEKKVEVSIADQMLRAWQGSLLVMETNISSGRAGHETPQGQFTAGPAKSRMHYSRLYDNSPMPWSVQVHGDIFIHGYHSVPRRPASHGCIRMPLRKKNAAKYFFDWVDLGTPVAILSEFSEAAERNGARD